MMGRLSWRIDYYTLQSGNKPVEEFINSLEERVQSKVIEMLELLKEFGINIGYPHAKKVSGTSLWELRIVGKDSIRIFYIAKEQRSFLLIHAFKKKTQKTDRKEIKVALERLKDYVSRALWK